MPVTQNSLNNLYKKNKFEGLTPPDFHTYYKAIVIKAVCY